MPRKAATSSEEESKPKIPTFDQSGLFGKELLAFMVSKGMLPVKIGDFSFVKTGILAIDSALYGGLVRGWITEIAGNSDRGKSTLSQILTANAAMQGYRVAYLDHEGTLVSKKWMKDMGIPLEQVWDGIGEYKDKLIHIFHPASLERGLEFCRIAARANIYDLIIYDSIGRAPTETMVESEIKQTSYSPMSRVMSDFSAKVTEAFVGSKTAMIMINTVYTNPGNKFYDINHPKGREIVSKADPTVSYMCGHRLWMHDPRSDDFEWDDEKSPNKRWVRRNFPVELWKSKSSPHPQKFHFQVQYNPKTDTYQLNVAHDILFTGLDLGVLTKRGPYFFMGERNIGQGEAKTEETIRTDPELAGSIITAIEDIIAENLAIFNATGEGTIHEEAEPTTTPDESDSDLHSGERWENERPVEIPASGT